MHDTISCDRAGAGKGAVDTARKMKNKNQQMHSESGQEYFNVPRVQERVSKRASERIRERSGASEQIEQCGESKGVSGASEHTSGWLSTFISISRGCGSLRSNKLIN